MCIYLYIYPYILNFTRPILIPIFIYECNVYQSFIYINVSNLTVILIKVLEFLSLTDFYLLKPNHYNMNRLLSPGCECSQNSNGTS